MAVLVLPEARRELDRFAYEQLEAGEILQFALTPIRLADDDLRILRSQRQSRASYHKNIAYRPGEDVVTGLASNGDAERLCGILRTYCREATALIARVLPRYTVGWRVDFTSFRPFEEAGRPASRHARNDLLHVDAFPTRPTNGDRILRVFTNVNTERPRVWLTGEPFGVLAERYADEAGFRDPARWRPSRLRRALVRFGRSLGLRGAIPSPYDAMMLRFHHFLKEHRAFQDAAVKTRVEFPPQTTWLVFTDLVSHAVLAGQYALEQTFIVPCSTLMRPEWAPVSVLERLAGAPLTSPR